MNGGIGEVSFRGMMLAVGRCRLWGVDRRKIDGGEVDGVCS